MADKLHRGVHILRLLTFALLGCAPGLSTASAAGTVNYETIIFFAGDGHSYTKYTTTRSDASRYSVFFDKSEGLTDYLYINPNDYEFDTSQSGANILNFPQGSYGVLSQGSYINTEQPDKSLVSVDADGVFTLTTWDGRKQPNGHYGFWNQPGNFTSFAAAWVFPENLQLLEYHSNRRGDWVQRGNTLAFFARDINDLTFEIRYQPSAQPTYSALKQQLRGLDAVDVQQGADSITVILENEILFASGSASLSDDGEQVIRDLAGHFAATADNIIVEGHTDNVAITGELVKTYPTNWELSAKRALNVVHALSSAGISPTRLQARAFGPFQPRVPNDSDANRRANRRIELIIQAD